MFCVVCCRCGWRRVGGVLLGVLRNRYRESPVLMKRWQCFGGVLSPCLTGHRVRVSSRTEALPARAIEARTGACPPPDARRSLARTAPCQNCPCHHRPMPGGPRAKGGHPKADTRLVAAIGGDQASRARRPARQTITLHEFSDRSFPSRPETFPGRSWSTHGAPSP